MTRYDVKANWLVERSWWSKIWTPKEDSGWWLLGSCLALLTASYYFGATIFILAGSTNPGDLWWALAGKVTLLVAYVVVVGGPLVLAGYQVGRAIAAAQIRRIERRRKLRAMVDDLERARRNRRIRRGW